MVDFRAYHGEIGLNLQISDSARRGSPGRRGNGERERVVASQGKTSTWASIGSGYLFAPNTINPPRRGVACLFVRLTGNCHRETVPRQCHASDLIYNRFAFHFQPFHPPTRGPPKTASIFTNAIRYTVPSGLTERELDDRGSFPLPTIFPEKKVSNVNISSGFSETQRELVYITSAFTVFVHLGHNSGCNSYGVTSWAREASGEAKGCLEICNRSNIDRKYRFLIKDCKL